MIKKRLSRIKKYYIGISFHEELWKYRFRKKRKDAKFCIKEKLVHVVIKIDEGYQIAWYLGSHWLHLEGLCSSFILKLSINYRTMCIFCNYLNQIKIFRYGLSKNEGKGTSHVSRILLGSIRAK